MTYLIKYRHQFIIDMVFQINEMRTPIMIGRIAQYIFFSGRNNFIPFFHVPTMQFIMRFAAFGLFQYQLLQRMLAIAGNM